MVCNICGLELKVGERVREHVRLQVFFHESHVPDLHKLLIKGEDISSHCLMGFTMTPQMRFKLSGGKA
jgi:hypothetical protein